MDATDTVMIISMICITIGLYIVGFNAGVKHGVYQALQATIKEWVEIKQRVSDSAWAEFEAALKIQHERRVKQAKRAKK